MVKKNLLFIAFFLFSFNLVLANNVELLKAQKLARCFIFESDLKISLNPDHFEILKDRTSGVTLAYVFRGIYRGFIVVSANDNYPPVIAYDVNNVFDNSSPLYNLLIFDLGTRNLNLYYLDKQVADKNFREWNRLLNFDGEKKLYQQWPPAGTTTTGGWTVTKWHQDAPYNNFCPVKLSNSQRSLTGCPATAMAQILFYHKELNNTRFNQNDRYYHNYTQSFWIDDSWQTYSYLSFDSLNNYLEIIENKFDSGNALNDNEMAALSLAAGFACKSVFDPAGSGTFGVNQAFEAYQRFGFTSAVLLNSQFTDEQIRQKMIDNIKIALPVHLATVDQSWNYGHNVVCDGYRDNGFFRLNMGWGGSYDSWYNLPSGFPMSLTVFEGIVADIQKTDTTLYFVNLTAVPDSIGTVLHGIGEYSEGELVMISVETVNGYVFDKWTGSAADVALLNDETSHTPFFTMPNRNVSLTANIIKPLFLVSFNVYGQGGAGVQGAVITVDSLAENLVTDQYGNAFTQLENGMHDFLVQASGYYDYTGQFSVQNDAVDVAVNMLTASVDNIDQKVLIGPNPFKDVLEIKNTGKILHVKLCTIEGKTIFLENENLTGWLQIPVSNLSNGSYILYILMNNGLEIKKLLMK